MKVLKQKLKKTPKKTNAKRKPIEPIQNRDLKVSQGQFEEHRLEMNSKFTSVHLEIKATRKKMSSKFDKVDKRFSRLEIRMDKFEQRMDGLDQRMDQLEQRMDQVEKRLEKVEIQLIEISNKIDKKIEKVESKIETVLAAIHQMRMLVEEQNNRNKFVLDGYANLYAIFEQNKQTTDQRFTQMEGFIKSLKPGPEVSSS